MMRTIHMMAAAVLGLASVAGVSAPASPRRPTSAQVVPLAPSDMTPHELATYQGLGNDPAAQMRFRDTRAYLRLCQQVVAGTLPPIDLPMEPDDYRTNYVSSSEQHTVDNAIGKNIAAIMSR